MRHKHLRFGRGFRVVLENDRSHTAQMTLAPDEVEGRPDNRHRVADQWLYVVSGTGVALLEGERHEIRNTGDEPLRTLNVHVPPAYPEDGGELPAGEPQ